MAAVPSDLPSLSSPLPSSSPRSLLSFSFLPASHSSSRGRPLVFALAGVSALVLTHSVSRRLSSSWALEPTALQRSGKLTSPLTSQGAPFLTTSAAMANVSLGTPAQRTLTIPPQKEHKATVVFMHGLGDTGEGWADVPTMMQLPHVKWILPSAPIKPVSVNGGFPCPSWFDIFGLSADAKEDKTGIDMAARYIAELLVKEKEAAPAGTKILVGGFSQGGALSLHLTARKHAGTFLDGSDATAVPLDGTICLSGWLPLYYSTLEGKTLKPTAASHPLLMCHGEADSLVQFSFGKLSAEGLKTLGFSDIQFKSYPGLAHSANPTELKDVETWIKALIS